MNFMLLKQNQTGEKKILPSLKIITKINLIISTHLHYTPLLRIEKINYDLTSFSMLLLIPPSINLLSLNQHRLCIN